MHASIRIGIIAGFLTSVSTAEWRREPLDSAAKGGWRHLFEGESKIYSYGTGSFAETPNQRTTTHRFYWRGKLALELTETEGKDDLYMGNTSKTMPDSGAATESWDYNKDGVIDIVRIAQLADEGVLIFGRYEDGVFALAPPHLNFTELWAYLAKTKSEQAGSGQPATRPESKSEGGDKPQPEAEGRSR